MIGSTSHAHGLICASFAPSPRSAILKTCGCSDSLRIESKKGSNTQEHVEKRQVEPHIHYVGRIEIRAAAQPFRCANIVRLVHSFNDLQDIRHSQSHESTVELASRKNDHPEPSIVSLFPKTIADPCGQRGSKTDGQEFETDHRKVAASPSGICFRVFSPESGQWVSAILRSIQAILQAQEEKHSVAGMRTQRSCLSTMTRRWYS